MKNLTTYSALILFCLCPANAMPVISSTQLNGSFEEGTLSPWGGGIVVENSSFAFEGSWFAETEATVNRSSLFVFFDAVPNNLTEFSLTFYARASAGGFSEVSAALSGRKEDNSFLYADITASNTSILSSSGWVEYIYEFNFQEPWDTDKSMGLSIDFSEGNPGALGFLDSVSLTQVPEPSHYTFLLSFLAFTWVLMGRVRSSR